MIANPTNMTVHLRLHNHRLPPVLVDDDNDENEEGEDENDN